MKLKDIGDIKSIEDDVMFVEFKGKLYPVKGIVSEKNIIYFKASESNVFWLVNDCSIG